MPRDPEQTQRLVLAMQQGGRVLYSKFLGKTLTERCKEIAEAENEMSLSDELQVARALVCDALEAYNNAIELALKSGVEGMRLSAIKQSAGAVVMNAIDGVKDIALAQRRILGDSALDTMAMQAVVLQVVQVIDSELQERAPVLRNAGIDPSDFSNNISQALRTHVRLPQGYDGTEHSPDDESLDDVAMAMDGTVPAAPSSPPATNGYHGTNGHSHNGFEHN